MSHSSSINFLNKLEIGRVDFLSLEPIDEFNRPFRFKVPQTAEYKSTKEKLAVEDFDLLSGNCLKTFKFGVTGLQMSNVSRLVRKIEDLSEFSLHNLIKEKVYFHNETMNRIYSKLNLNVKKNVIEDQTVSRDYWIPFIVYTMIFSYLFSGTKKLEYLDVFPQYSGLIYRLIAITSFQVTNMTFRRMHWLRFKTIGRFSGRFRLNNVWSKLGLGETISPFIPFIQRKKFKKLFSNYEMNEMGDRKYFTQTHRNKILFDYIQSAINIAQMKEDKTFDDFLFLHDRFAKDGKSNLTQFEEILDDIEDLIFNKKAEGRKVQKIKNFFNNLKNFGEQSDFLDTSLDEDTKYRFYDPMFIDIPPLVDYFGEKIGMMFNFISYYGVKKYYIIWVTTVFYIVLNFTPVKDMQLYKYLQLIQMLLINIYSLNFYEKWNQKEKLFAMKYGQTHNELKKETRVNFKGDYQRNLATNEMNEQEVELGKVFGRRLAVYIINTILLMISIAVSFAISSMKTYLAQVYFLIIGQDQSTSSTAGTVLSYLLVILNAIIVELLNILYDLIYVRMTNFENYSDLGEYESSLLIKRFSFKLFNMFNSMIIIAVLKGGFPFFFGECSNFGIEAAGTTKCFTELRIQGSLTSAGLLRGVDVFRADPGDHSADPVQGGQQAEELAHKEELLLLAHRPQAALANAQAQLRNHEPNRRESPGYYEVHYR